MIQIILLLVLLYLIAGFLFAAWFSFRIVDKFDAQAKGAPILFRLLIIPGSILLWPVLLKKYIEQKKK